MKDKSWIIILIMGIALTISLGYSIFVSQKAKKTGESTVTTTSIIEMKASTVTIKNTLTGTGVIEYKEKIEDETINNQNEENNNNNEENNLENITENSTENNIDSTEETPKTYQITLSIEDKDFEKAKVGQIVEIAIKEEENTLNYTGLVKKINKDANNKSTLNIEIQNPDEKIQENMNASCTVIIEKAENVVGLPVEAIQKDEEGKEYVDVMEEAGNSKKVYIETGISDDYYVEVSSGLNVGDSVQIVKSTTTVVNKNGEKNKNEISEK